VIVTVTPTIMDGQVVRWYASEAAEEAHRPLLSASRNGVMIHAAYLHHVEELLDAARDTHARLERGEDVEDVATHRSPMFGPLEPIGRGTRA
jgi:hypothetical protein